MEGLSNRRTSKRLVAGNEEEDQGRQNDSHPKKQRQGTGTADESLTANGDRSHRETSPSVDHSMEGATCTVLDDPMDYLKNLTPLPKVIPPLRVLTKAEIDELETVLEFQAPDSEDHWRDDWGGNLSLTEKDVLNPGSKIALGKKSFRQPLILWAVNAPSNTRLLHNLLLRVCSTPNVPQAVKKIFGGMNDATPAEELIRRMRRASYDPEVLKEDGWATVKSDKPQGATGGAFLIGDKITCDGADAVIIAYVHDSDIGDLWKALWVDDLISFDLEAEELLEAKRKWDRRYNQSAVDPNKSRRSSRFSVSNDFTVKGIEYGIVLAASYSRGFRPGVYWPARVMHPFEVGGNAGPGRRSSSKQKVDLVFLAPYWSADEQPGRSRRVESMSENGELTFKANPLLQVETIDATDEMLKEYPYSNGSGLDIAQLQMSFRFTGLPKSAFSRYLDAHRLAMALREYAKLHLKSPFTATDRASAGLFETHPMSVQAPNFPSVVLHLPFTFILSQLPRPPGERPLGSLQGTESNIEPVLKLNNIVNAMKPPCCWGDEADNSIVLTPVGKEKESDELSPAAWLTGADDDEMGKDQWTAIESFMINYPLLNENFNRYCSSPPLVGVLSSITRLLAQLAEEEAKLGELTITERRSKLKALATSWSIVKRMGEESLASLLRPSADPVLVEWRRATEQIYRYMLGLFSDGKEVGNGLSVVITDARCNEHRTSSGCFERPVRLPAALRGAKLAGAGVTKAVRLVTSVSDRYVELVEKTLLAKTHCSSYLKRIKSRCASAKTEDEVLILTDNSDGEGGEDTNLTQLLRKVGSQGTWKAAVTGVAAAVTAADMVVRGECVNAFCVTRPPGHHAGRSLHPMKAVSNGFCILNAVACTALYATSPVSEGGLGLSRVCVIDFDVHHGNGTQDILCSTYDHRFLYVSLHAGGAEINGHPMEDDPDHELHDLGINPKMSGIYPGRCGDTSPHKGVLNVPLGAKVTSHAVGTALIGQVSPRVEAFSPDLIILSAGFDAHKSDPMGLGGLRAEDFGHITQVACEIAFKSCSGRVVSVLEGGYGVPCCRPQQDLFLPTTSFVRASSKSIPDVHESQQPMALETSMSPVKSVHDSNQLNGGVSSKLSSVLHDSTQKVEGESSLPTSDHQKKEPSNSFVSPAILRKRPQPSKLLDLGDDIPSNMDDQVPFALQVRLEKCNAEGFVECVRHHVQSLAQCNKLR